MSLKDWIEAEAHRLGFTLTGIAPVSPPPHLAVYQAWIASGLHAEMHYLSNDRALERRADPRLILPGVQVLLVAALPYPPANRLPDDWPNASGEALGRVASYAWGVDYHYIIPPLLQELLRLVEKMTGRTVASRIYSDTGPVLERDFAQQAGLGWIGKNTCLISPGHGSFFLLGEALLDVEIEPSVPFTEDHCGSCRRCIEACPTTCIRPDRTIDSRRCISYLTIENKGDIPVNLRPSLGDWVFGCDICQAVCPWNRRFAPSEGHPLLTPTPGVPRPVLRREIHLTPREFNQKFRRSPILRAKRRGYLRNLAVAAGNLADPATVPDLETVLTSEPEPLVRAHAAWAMGRMRSSSARLALSQSLRRETDPKVLHEIQGALDESTTII